MVRLAHFGKMAGLIAAVATSLGLPVSAAHANSAAAEYFAGRADRSAVPRLLSEDERAYYKSMFAAIKHQDWKTVQALFAQKPDGQLHGVARAEYYLAAGSPRVDAPALAAWLATGANLPEADQIAALAAKRGATGLAPLPQQQALVSLPSAPRRAHPRDVADGTMPARVASAIAERIKADDPAGAKQLLDGVDAMLSAPARAEWRQHVAWSFYIENQDADAYAMAVSAGQGGASPITAAQRGASQASATQPTLMQTAATAPSPGTVSGAWTAEGWWTAGLAAWRMGDCAAAGTAFRSTAQAAANPELAAAAYYWQARAALRCRRPDQVTAPLRQAAAFDETMYGLLAAEQLGMKPSAAHSAPDFNAADWQALRDTSNVRAAVALAEVGEDGLADEVLRHQARIGSPEQFQPLSRLARDIGLPATQLWMAYNAPAGGAPAPASRYPTPKWTPVNGWQVDPALVLAHSLQESQFRANVVSPAGARGLMQIMPAAARDHAGALGVAGTASDLTRPEVNLAFGQLHLQALRDSGATGGLLLKVIAAYNAGPLPIAHWNTQIHADGDPLLWMESVPYWETRGYVATVVRNYWMYEGQAGGPSESRVALAQGLWPTFPGMAGGKAVRVAASNISPAHQHLASED